MGLGLTTGTKGFSSVKHKSLQFSVCKLCRGRGFSSPGSWVKDISSLLRYHSASFFLLKEGKFLFSIFIALFFILPMVKVNYAIVKSVN